MTESELMKVQGNGDITAAGEKLRAEAVRILTAPLAYTGIHLSEEMLTMILSETECDPVRVRMGGKSLVSVLGNKDYAGYEETDTPYYEVSNVHYLKALSVLKEMTENFAEEPEEEEIAEEPVETENVEESIESEAAEESEETDCVEESDESETIEFSEETEIAEEEIEFSSEEIADSETDFPEDIMAATEVGDL